MIRHLTDKFSFANVIALIALFAALGGTAVASGVMITSPSQVKKNVITGKSVRDGSIRSADVGDRSLKAKDFARGQLPAGARGATGAQGPKGDAGPQGATGAQGPAGATKYEFRSVTSASNSDSPKEIMAECPEGTFVIGSYYDIAGGKTGTAPNQVARVVADKLLPTGPNGIVTDTPNRVYLQAYESEAITDNWSLRVGVTCAAMTP